MSKWKQAYATSTEAIISKYEREPNPVTKSVYRTIIGNRIDRQEMFRLETKESQPKVSA
jgi:hypothetical protein